MVERTAGGGGWAVRRIPLLALRQLRARQLLDGLAVGGVAMGGLVLLVVNAVT